MGGCGLGMKTRHGGEINDHKNGIISIIIFYIEEIMFSQCNKLRRYTTSGTEIQNYSLKTVSKPYNIFNRYEHQCCYHETRIYLVIVVTCK